MTIQHKLRARLAVALSGVLALTGLAHGARAAVPGEAQSVLTEAQYSRNWCQKEGEQLPRLTGAPTPVCELGQYRVAVVFAENWAAAIGCAYFATIDSGKKPGAALIMREAGDQRYWNLLNRAINKQHLPFRTWLIQP